MIKIFIFVSLTLFVSACVTPAPSEFGKEVSVKTPPERTAGPEKIRQCLLGWKATSQGQYSTALNLYDSCIETGNLTKPSLARTYRNIGITYRRMKGYETSINYFNTAMTLEPADI